MTSAGRRPNLFLVGAMKCGTTSLHNTLAGHPSIFMCQRPKEPNWFAGGNSGKSLDWYLERFAGATDESYVGESSTDYTRAPRLKCPAAKIREFSPDARILYLVRDPVARAISHYWWDVEYSAEGRSFPDAMTASREIIDIGNYAMQIEPYLETFGRDRVHVLTMEALTAEPEETLAAVFGFLGLDSVAATPPALKHDNRGKAVVPRVPGPFSHLKGTPLWKAAKAVMPAKFRRKAIAALAKPVERVIPDDDFAAGLEIIRPRMIEETARLSRLLGREFPEWRALHDGVASADSSA